MEKVSKEEMEKIRLMNQFVGLNPTGQLELTENGTFKTLGNPARVVSPSMLQTQSLEKTSTNTPIDTQTQVVVKEGFEVMNHKQNRLNADFLGRPLHRPEGVALEANGFVKGDIQDDSKVRYMVYILGLIIILLLFIINIKKM
jgi:hypothetical protein